MNYNETEIRVRYGETDQMGVVYHANYAMYFEVGRTEWLREFGLSYSRMEAEGIMLPVISLSIKYKNSARYDDVLKVKTTLKKLPTASIEFEYELWNDSNVLLATGNTVLAFIDKVKNRPTRCPKYLLDKLQDYSS
ncbi:acyl-CoA thioester hydrolase [Winogradskyella epiphytica]|uniref:Acyl-CoA thioester hydrolase n=1 Tax=Winogradskyella epiphytica TaxID=262005 RepID=A0A2V4WW45_9FLAO|nr:thioesterase family protein [Winogradskyella epiphytica]PYE81446.1 acyl-CoA thioester hydrolase [Winogradskyella epiphytica]GGW65059.1 thioesterase [Winogradskyella epiphytica]